jgi:hypothetical protein
MSCSAKPTISKPITTCKTVTGSSLVKIATKANGEQSCVAVRANEIIQRLFPAGLKFLRQLLDDFVGRLAALARGMAKSAGA